LLLQEFTYLGHAPQARNDRELGVLDVDFNKTVAKQATHIPA